jgi:hypothetical protein
MEEKELLLLKIKKREMCVARIKKYRIALLIVLALFVPLHIYAEDMSSTTYFVLCTTIAFLLSVTLLSITRKNYQIRELDDEIFFMSISRF